MKRKNVIKTNEQWQLELSPEVYYICRLKGTESPSSGKYDQHFEDGTYSCVCCGNPLFSSKGKYEAHTGWPSFYEPIADAFVEYRRDRTGEVARVEIVCSACHSHLGYLYNDGPEPSRYRYNINSLALTFATEQDASTE